MFTDIYCKRVLAGSFHHQVLCISITQTSAFPPLRLDRVYMFLQLHQKELTGLGS